MRSWLQDTTFDNISFRHIAAQILGFNFKDEKAIEALKIWHAYTKKNIIWDEQFPEQLLLSVILERLGLGSSSFPFEWTSFGLKKNDKTIFKVEYRRKKIYSQ